MEEREPDYRFSFANERTFLAWVRTALALVVGALALTQLSSINDDVWKRVLVGVPPVLEAIFLLVTSLRHWRHCERAMRRDEPLPIERSQRVSVVVFLVIWAIAAGTAAVIS